MTETSSERLFTANATCPFGETASPWRPRPWPIALTTRFVATSMTDVLPSPKLLTSKNRPSGVAANRVGLCPTLIRPISFRLAASITETVSSPKFPTYIRPLPGGAAIWCGSWPTGTATGAVSRPGSITVTVLAPALAT